MAFTYGFYNSKNHDRKYNAIEMSQIFDGLIHDGVYASVGKCFLVKATEYDNTVIVQSGRAWFDHTWNYNDADIMIQGEQSELLLKRIDAIVIDINAGEDYRENSILWIKGNAHSTNPEKPSLINTLEHHQYPLAYIYREPNVEKIDQEKIENAVGSSDCPFVTGIIDYIDINDLLIQWKDQWEQFVKKYEETAIEWTNEQKEDFLTFYTEFKAQMEAFENASSEDFNDWFTTLKNILSENAAGNLLNLINEGNEREFNRYYGLINSSTIISKNENNETIISTETSEGILTTTFQNVDVGTKFITLLEPSNGSWNYRKVTTIDKITDSSKITITTEYEKLGKTSE